VGRRLPQALAARQDRPLQGAKIVAVTPDYAEVAKLADLWLHPKYGTDAAMAMAMGHVILKERVDLEGADTPLVQ